MLPEKKDKRHTAVRLGDTQQTPLPQPVSPSLFPQERKAVEDSRSARCEALAATKKGFKQIAVILSTALQKAMLIAGFRQNAEMNDTERQSLIIEMISCLQRHPWLSIAELKTVLDLGLSGELDTAEKSYMLNVRTLSFWIHAYRQQVREQAFKKQLQYCQQQEEQQEEKLKQQAYLLSMKKNRKALLLLFEKTKAYVRDEQITPGEALFDEHTDHLCLAMYFVFQKANAFRETPSAKRDLWEQESQQETLSPLQFIKAQKNCRIRMVKRLMADLLNNNQDLEEYLKAHHI